MSLLHPLRIVKTHGSWVLSVDGIVKYNVPQNFQLIGLSG